MFNNVYIYIINTCVLPYNFTSFLPFFLPAAPSLYEMGFYLAFYKDFRPFDIAIKIMEKKRNFQKEETKDFLVFHMDFNIKYIFII
jgi:hypothetical protein